MVIGPTCVQLHGGVLDQRRQTIRNRNSINLLWETKQDVPTRVRAGGAKQGGIATRVGRLNGGEVNLPGELQ